MQPRVSIVTPIYNAAAFLAEAIESVIAQDYENWELLLVDDGSIDGSRTIAENWCRKDARLRLLSHPGEANRGSSASRNLAFAAARGELLAMLDADDVWLSGKLKFQVETLDAHPEAAMTFGAAQRWYSWNTSACPDEDYVVPSALPGFGPDTLIPPPALLQAFLYDESLTPCTCAVLFRRSVARGADVFEASFPGLYDDQVFLAKICLTQPVFATSRCVARYRKHSNSCCAQAHRNGTEAGARGKFLAWLATYESLCVR